MKPLIALYFFILATIQLGLLVGVYHYYRSQGDVKPSSYWMSSLAVSVLGLFIFGAGILTIEDIDSPSFSFTIANSLFYATAVLQMIFCTSLNQRMPNTTRNILLGSVLVFAVFFEFMRVYGTFQIRTIFMCVLASLFYGWQIYEIRIKRRAIPSRQLAYLQFATAAEMFFALGRLMILIITTLSMRRVEQIPQALILFTILQMVMNTLSFIAIGNYWAEQIARQSARAGLENEEIRSLLGERESLIASLLRANKTAATGALSASIAHELNQPLGASNLNIQFLQKKIAEGELNPKLAEEVLAALLADNQRAANIIKSLRAIFTESKLEAEKVAVRQLIDAVLQITNPETHSKNIEVLLKLDAEFEIEVNRNEIQQVILNLMNNAIEALSISSQADKKITIVSQGLANTWQLSISDNAEGISADDQVRLFELLGSGKKTGMGLGLWLCRHIVTRHGGEIWYEDVVSGGAKFVFTLPRDASALS